MNNARLSNPGISPITVRDGPGPAGAFIPYTNRAIKWHTDGYYNPPERTIRAIVDATMTVQDPLQKMRAALQAHVGVLMSGDDMVYVLLFEWRSVRGEARELIIAERDRYERYWATMLDAMKVQGYIRPEVDIELTRLIGLGAINWVATWYKRGGRYNLEQVGEAIWQMLAGGVLAHKYQAEAARL